VWRLHYRAFCLRYADAISQATQQIGGANEIEPLQSQWNQRAFGTYLALVQQVNRQGAYAGLKISLKALHHLHALAEKDESLHRSVKSCFLTLLNHQIHEIRQFAFDNLQRLGMDLGELGKVATTSPQQDIAKQGLALLVTHSSLKDSHALLQTLIQGDDAMLSVEAFVLYREDKGLVDAAHYALQSYHMPLRYQCVNELAAQVGERKAQVMLVNAVQNDYAAVAIKAATHLARQPHKKALALLSELLAHNTDEAQQRRIISGLKQLSDQAVAAVVFDYLQHNKNNRQDALYLYKMLADYRHIALFDGLLQRLVSHPKEITGITHALILITGYDQPFEDFYERKEDRSWIDKQHPRHDALLIRLFNTMIKMDHHDLAANLVPALSWPNSKVINKKTDQALQDAIPVIDPQYLASLVKTLFYRLKRRASKTDTLVSLLTNKAADIQLLAAEALALNGYHQGFAILLAAVDYQEKDNYRQRAVLALGKSGDQRALDKLLVLAKDKEHALNEVAIEAIGSMGDSEQSETIFALLKSSLQHADYYSDMNQRALNGLRCFNRLAAWQIIAAYIENTQYHYSDRKYAVNLLQYWDTKASRTLLLNLLRQEADDDVVKTAYQVAQRLWKTAEDQTSEVDYALLQGHYPDLDEKALERITLYAPTATLLALLADDYTNTTESDVEVRLGAIHHCVLKRNDCTTKEINKALQSHSTRLINTVASLLTRKNSLTTTVKVHLQNALERYYQRWDKEYQQFNKQQGKMAALEQRLTQTKQAVERLLWAAVKQGVINDTLLLLLSTSKKEQQAFQLHILNALLSLEELPNKAVLAPLENLLHSSVREVSRLANQLIQAHTKNKGIDWRYFQGQPSIVLDQQFKQTLIDAVSTPAQQAQALPLLIAKQDSVTLLMIANDKQQQETLRIGAIEGLACILTKNAQQALSTLHQESDDKEISKVAYRALRRQQRSQIKADQCAVPTGVSL
jgi:ParB family chromosome partitioning protein